MIKWLNEVVENDYHCYKCGAKVIDDDKNVNEKSVLFLRNNKGYCKHCGHVLCGKVKE